MPGSIGTGRGEEFVSEIDIGDNERSVVVIRTRFKDENDDFEQTFSKILFSKLNKRKSDTIVGI